MLQNRTSEFCELQRVTKVALEFHCSPQVKVSNFKDSLSGDSQAFCTHGPFSLLTQAIAILSCNTGQVFPAVQCDENGSFSPRTSLSNWATQCKWIGIGRICHLQRGAGK